MIAAPLPPAKLPAAGRSNLRLMLQASHARHVRSAYDQSMASPLDGVTFAEAAHILGVSVATVRRLICAGELEQPQRHGKRQLSRREVEQLAVARYDRNHRPGSDSYWVTRPEAARILDVNQARVWQLAQRGFLPYETAPGGTRLYRRAQLRVIANARASRRWADA